MLTQEIVKSLDNLFQLSNLDLNLVKAIKFSEFLTNILKTDNVKSVGELIQTCENAHFFEKLVKSHHTWERYDVLAENIWYLLLALLQGATNKYNLLQFLRTHGGITFFMSSVKTHFSSLIIVRSAIICTCEIIEFYKSLRTEAAHESVDEDLLSPTLAMKQIKKRKPTISKVKINNAWNSIVNVTPMKELTIVLLNSGIGFCLPRAFDLGCELKDNELSLLCVRIVDFLIEHTTIEYMITTCSYNKCSILRCLNTTSLLATEDIKKVAITVIFKLIAVHKKITELLIEFELWKDIQDSLQNYGNEIDFELKWLIACIYKLKELNKNELSPTISVLLGIMKDRLSNEDDASNTAELLSTIMNGIDDEVSSIQPHQVELWPTLNNYNSYGFYVKRLPNINERMKLNREVSLTSSKRYATRKQTPNYMLPTVSSTEFASPRTNSRQQQKAEQAFVDSEDEMLNSDDFLTSFSTLVFPSMSKSITSIDDIWTKLPPSNVQRANSRPMTGSLPSTKSSQPNISPGKKLIKTPFSDCARNSLRKEI